MPHLALAVALVLLTILVAELAVEVARLKRITAPRLVVIAPTEKPAGETPAGDPDQLELKLDA